MVIKAKFGEKLRDMRLEKGLSQEDLAEKSGLHRTYISSIEQGKRNVSLINIQALADALECEIKDFFTIGEKSNGGK